MDGNYKVNYVGLLSATDDTYVRLCITLIRFAVFN